jgi:Type I phosphodiesterase / nucleotide pyrophosphatase
MAGCYVEVPPVLRFPMRSVTSRRASCLFAVLLMLASACTGSTSSSTGSRAAVAATGSVSATGSSPRPKPSTVVPAVRPGSLQELACSIPHEWLLRTWRGWRPDRGAEIQILPKEYDFVGSGLPHVGPWPYVNDVPMFWYGPGHIAARGAVDRPVTAAGVAPTQAALLHFDGFHAPDGIPMDEAIEPGQQPPKLLVTVVWDAGGRDVLSAWPDSWPYLRSLIPKGTWYEHATVGSSPTSTAQIHATIGTGAFPDHHGIIAHRLRIGGHITTPWANGPQWLVDPTLADLYDRAMGNEPIVGELATVSIHLGLLGHGAMWGGGDKDIAVVREVANSETLGEETYQWNLSPELRPYFRFPAYLNDIGGLEQDAQALDAADGRQDGKWRSNDISQLLQGFDTPARIPYQTRVLEQMIEREGFGRDDVPDLLFVNYKEIDYISHIWSMNSLEMRDAVQAQDAALETLVDFLNRQVGQGQWAMVVTADHGSMISPRVSGGFQISSTPIAAGINQTFDHDGDDTHIVQLIQPTQIFVDADELRQNGYTLAEVSEWIMGLTQGETAGAGTAVDPATADDTVFQAAFPSAMMQDLPCLPEARA